MEIEKLIKEISDSIDNLSQLRDRLYELETLDSPEIGIIRMKDIFHDGDYSYLSKRVCTTLRNADLLELSVSAFVLQWPPSKYLRLRFSGKKSAEYIKKVLKEQCNIKWY